VLHPKAFEELKHIEKASTSESLLATMMNGQPDNKLLALSNLRVLHSHSSQAELDSHPDLRVYV
jgi:hypothetical protein